MVIKEESGMRSSDNAIDLYSLSSYTITVKKEPLSSRDVSLPASLCRLRTEFKLIGKRRSVEAVLLVHHNNIPHVLLLQMTSSTTFDLPGGELEFDEDELDGLSRYLSKYLGFVADSPKWEVVDLVANWYRPNFEHLFYPYIPAHVTQPKEHRRIYFVRLLESAQLTIPNNYRLVATPFFELYANSSKYGRIISSLPQVLSRFHFRFT